MMDHRPRLATFATRPPTPPRQRTLNSPEPLQDTDHFLKVAQDSILDTPEESPASSAEYFGRSPEKRSKRVGFSPWTKFHKPMGNGSKIFGLENQIRVLPPSRECKSSTKSILKPSTEFAGVSSMGVLPHLDQHSSISRMLDSVTQHLASNSQNSRIDAYTALLGCLSAYDDVPDFQELVEKLPDLTNYICRDVSVKNEETGSLNTHLVAQALKLFTFFVDTPGISDALTDDFCSFMMEQALISFEDERVPKIVTTHYMLLLAKQNFAPKHIGPDRMNRLITGLDNVASKIKGNRVVWQRLMIYRRLLTQAKSLMIARIGDWIDHLITGMLSTTKEIRSWAISLGLEASLSLGTTKVVSQACVDMFNRESPEGKKVVDCVASRLSQMANSKDDGIHVPQIWVIVILFLRSRRNQLESWEHLKPWLLIIQKCFNSGEPQIKFQANMAWNRLVFAMNLDMSTSPAMVKMLRQPVASQLDRKNDQKVSKHAKLIARSSYCNLLYYAFRPSATHAQLDQYWEEYISQMPPFRQCINSADVDLTCDILAALFSSSQPKVWDENRANIKEAIKPGELPCLDPRWVRMRSAKIFKIFENLLTIADWHPRKEQEVPILKAWRSLLTALGEASNKEVKVSMETMAAIANLVNTIKYFWQHSLKQKQALDGQGLSNLIDRFELLVNEAVAKFGSIPFTEKRLVRSSKDSFEAAETPSNRAMRSQAPLSSPVSSLLDLVVSSVGQKVTDNFMRAVGNLVDLALHSATSRRTQLAILRDLIEPVSYDEQLVSTGRVCLWKLAAKAAIMASEPPKAHENRADSPQNVGYEYRDASKILEIAIRHHSTEAITEWLDLAANISYWLKQEIGDEAVVLMVIEPLAAVLDQTNIPENYSFNLTSALFLLENTRWPESRQTIDRARKMLWGVGLVSQKNASLDPFDHLYSMTNTMLNTAYSQFQSTRISMIKDLISAVTTFISSCPPALKIVLLKRIQNGLSIWIEDAEELLKKSSSIYDSTSLYGIVMNLWAEVVTAIEMAPKIDGKLLLIIETLMISSFKSKQRAVLNDLIHMWNRTFGATELLEYPPALLPFLLKLRQLTDLSLPNLPEGIDTDVSFSPLHFNETQLDEEQSESTSSKRYTRTLGAFRLSETREDLLEGSNRRSRVSAPKQSPKGRMQDTTPKSTPKARLRHDDSQVQFAAIESSPLVAELVDSQLLTDHQKEVRERQGFERGAMFPDLRLSPKSRTREQDNTPPKLILKGRQRSYTGEETDHHSQILPHVDDISDDVFTCSPTPRSNKGKSDQLSFSSGVPRSSGEIQVGESSDDDLPSTVNKVEECAIELQSGKMELDTEPAPECPTRDRKEDGGDRHPEASIDDNTGISAHTLDEDMADVDPPLDSEISLGATSNPLQNIQSGVQEQRIDVLANQDLVQRISPCDDRASGGKMEDFHSPKSGAAGDVPEKDFNNQIITEGDKVIQIADSFQEPQRGQFTSEDDQIAAQLVSDLERASSQAEATAKGALSTTRQPIEASTKRKNSAENFQPAKKSKMQLQPQMVQVVIDSREGEEADDACIFVEEKSHFYSATLQVKRKAFPTYARSSALSSRRLEAGKDHSQGARSWTVSNSPEQECWPTAEVKHHQHVKIKSDSDDHPEASMTTIPSQRRSPHLLLPSVECPSSKCYNIDDEARSVDAESNSSCEGEETPDSAAIDNQGERSPFGSMGVLNPGLQNGRRQMGREQATTRSRSPAEAIGLSSSEGGAVQQTIPESSGQMGMEMEAQGKHEVREILEGFKRLVGDIRHVRLGAEEEREMIGLLFECVGEVHEAGRRSRSG